MACGFLGVQRTHTGKVLVLYLANGYLLNLILMSGDTGQQAGRLTEEKGEGRERGEGRAPFEVYGSLEVTLRGFCCPYVLNHPYVRTF